MIVKKWKLISMTLVAALLSTGLLPLGAAAQDTDLDRFLFVDQSYNFGRAVSDEETGGSMAWGQSYYSNAYVDMYETTGERFWLDKIVDQTDRIVANARDHDNDGNLGWADFGYAKPQIKNSAFSIPGASRAASAEHLENSSFEVDTDNDNTPDNWILQGDSGSVYRSTASGDSFDGTAGVIVTSNGVDDNRLVQPFAYESGKSYIVEVFAGVETEQTEAVVDVFNATTGSVLGMIRVHHVGFERYVYEFTAPSNGILQLRLGLESYTEASYKARFDAVSVKFSDAPDAPAPETAALDNGGMENPDPLDNTMAAGWIRWPESTSANVYMTTDAFSGSNALAVTTDHSSWEVAEQVIDYLPGHIYTLTFKGKVMGGAASGLVSVYNETDAVVLGNTMFSSTSWDSYSLTFTAPQASGKTVKIRLLQSDWQLVGFTSLFDDFEMSYTAPANLVINGAFESAEGDPTLPAGWTRTSDTSSTDIYLSSGINNYYSYQWGVAMSADNVSAKGLEQTLPYVPDETYAITFWARTTDPRYPGELQIYDETGSVMLGSSNIAGTAWSKHVLKYTAPSTTGHTVKLRLVRPASPGQAIDYIDDISIRSLAMTEAAAWTREATPFAAAHRYNDPTVFADEWGLRLVHDGSSAPVIVQQLHNYRPNSEYGINFNGKVSPGATGRVRLQDRTTNTTLGSWSFNEQIPYMIEYFQTPEAGHELFVEISIPSGSANDMLWIDSIMVAPSWENQVHEAMIGSAILRFVNTVYADSSLHAAYKAKADTYRNFIADNLVHKWDPWWRQISGVDGHNNGSGVYLFPEGFSTEWFPGRTMPHNQYLMVAELFYQLYEATEGEYAYAVDRPFYWSRANDMARAFKETIYAHPLNSAQNTDAYLWHYWDPMGPWDEGHYAVYNYEDMSHAAITMTGVLGAYRRGQVFTYTDMQKFARTMTDIMWNGSLTNPIVSWDNSRGPVNTGDNMLTIYYHNWTYMAEIDPLIRDISAAICDTLACSPTQASGIAKWSGNKIANSDFELADPLDPTLPYRWVRWQGDSSTVYRTTCDPGMGEDSVIIKTDGSAWQVLEQPIADYELNTDYTISFLGKVYGLTDGRAEVYDYTTSTLLGSINFSETSWTRKAFTVRTPAGSGHNIRVRLYTGDYTLAMQQVGFDDVRALPSLSGTEVANAGFETADRWDFTLPRYWQRGEETSMANVLLDTTDKHSGLSSLKLVSAAGAEEQELFYEWKGYKSSGAYTVTIEGKSSGAAGGKVAIIDTSSNTELASTVISAANWTASTMTFTAPSAYDRTLKIVISHNNPSVAGTVWVDEMNIRSE